MGSENNEAWRRSWGTVKKSGIWKYELHHWPHYLHMTLITIQQVFAVKPLLCVPLECFGGGRRQEAGAIVLPCKENKIRNYRGILAHKI